MTENEKQNTNPQEDPKENEKNKEVKENEKPKVSLAQVEERMNAANKVHVDAAQKISDDFAKETEGLDPRMQKLLIGSISTATSYALVRAQMRAPLVRAQASSAVLDGMWDRFSNEAINNIKQSGELNEFKNAWNSVSEANNKLKAAKPTKGKVIPVSNKALIEEQNKAIQKFFTVFNKPETQQALEKAGVKLDEPLKELAKVAAGQEPKNMPALMNALMDANTGKLTRLGNKVFPKAPKLEANLRKLMKEGLNSPEVKTILENIQKNPGLLKKFGASLKTIGKWTPAAIAGFVGVEEIASALHGYTYDDYEKQQAERLETLLNSGLNMRTRRFSAAEKRDLLNWAIANAGSEAEKAKYQQILSNGCEDVASVISPKDVLKGNDKLQKTFNDLLQTKMSNSWDADFFTVLSEMKAQAERDAQMKKQENEEIVKPIGAKNQTETDTGSTTDTEGESDTDTTGESDENVKEDEAKDKKPVSKDEIFKVVEIEKKGDQASEDEKKEREDILKRLQTNGVDASVPEEIKAELRKANLLPEEGGKNKDATKPGNDTTRTTVPPVVRGGGGTVTIPGGGGTTVVPGANAAGTTTAPDGTVLGPDGKPVKTDDLPMAIAQAEQQSFWSKYGTWILGILGIGGLAGLAVWLINREKKKTKQAKNDASNAQSAVNELTDKVAELEKQAAENAANSGTTQDTTNSSSSTNGTLSDFAQPVADDNTALALINNSNTRV